MVILFIVLSFINQFIISNKMPKQIFYLILGLLQLLTTNTLINILQQGAIPHVDTLAAQFKNSEIIRKSILKANSSISDRVIKIPNGVFYSMPIVLKQLYNISIVIQGKLSASKNILSWTKKPNSPDYQDFIYISNSKFVQISGGGKVDGRGYHWWMVQWLRLKRLRPLNSARPHLFNIEKSSYFKIHDLVLKNSPCFHLRIADSFYFDIYYLDIKVNATAQFNLAKKFSIQGVVPLFPLNTDGIDPSGRYFHIWNITVQNYDDVVVPKPSHRGYDCDCTQHMLIQNITIRLGVGLSIGSVPPNSQHNCIRNVTFRNAVFEKPFKAIYLKTNPGNSGSGEIVNIHYYNMKINEPIWWAIYLGPQQQKQPLGGGPGCMIYPFDPRGTCQTQPRIDIRNVTLENIQVHNSLLFPIVMRCNQSNPCSGITLKNVKVDYWRIGKQNKGYVCEYVQGSQEGGHPKVDCLKQNEGTGVRIEDEETKRIENEISIPKLWQHLQNVIKSIGYIEQDDEMDDEVDFEILLEDYLGYEAEKRQ